MYVRTAVLTGLLLSSSCSFSRPLPYSISERIRTISLQGWNSAYNLELAHADQLFDEASGLEPLHPRPYLGKAMISFWRFLLNKHEDDKDKFLALADRTISAAEEYEDRYGEDADVKVCLGTIYGYRSFVYGRSKSYLKGAWDGKKSYDYFYDALKLDPKIYDAYLGIGLFHYFVTFIPKPLQWVVSVMGVTGDSKVGLKEIRVASQRGTFAKTEAQYYIAQFLPWQEGEFETSEQILVGLHEQFPSNTLLTFTLAVWEMKRGDIRSAKDKLTAIIQFPGDDLIGIRTFTSYKLAECYFRLNDFKAAREEYQRFLQRYRDQIYSATANYRIGFCYELAGQRDSAIVYYQRAAKNERRFGDDAYSARKAELLLGSPMLGLDSLLCTAQNAGKSGNHDGAFRIFSRLNDVSQQRPDVHAEILYGLGESLYERKLYSDALASFRQIPQEKIERELWLKPWAHYYSGLCFVKIGEPFNAKKEFELALEYEEYDFKNWLDFRSRRELDKLDK